MPSWEDLFKGLVTGVAGGAPVSGVRPSAPSQPQAPQDSGPYGNRSAVGGSMSQRGRADLSQFEAPDVSTVGVDTRKGIDPAMLDRGKDWSSLYNIELSDALARVKDMDGSDVWVGEYLERMHGWLPADIEAHQRRLLQAGLLGRAKASDITWGQVDEVTLAGTHGLLMRTARYNANSTQSRTVSDVLAEAMTRRPGTTAEGAELSGYGNAHANLRKAMQALLGRNPNAREVRRFKRRLNQAERSSADEAVEGLGRFGLTPDDVDDDPTDYREGDSQLLAETEVLGNNGVEHTQYRAGQLTNLFEQMMVGRR